MKNIIEINNLTKRYGKLVAVDNLSFKVKEGELFAFLGVNGAGKSTTINIMCQTLAKDSGKITIDGIDLDSKDSNKIKSEIGVVFQSSVLDKPLTVYDNLEGRASLYGIMGEECKERIAELAKMLDFEDLYDRRVGKLSGGQRRRIDIARALIHRPRILVLDEPTTGLDPQTRKTLWQVISDLRKNENLTVFLTTHYMEEAADADYVVVIDGGKIAAEGTPLELKNRYTGDYIILYGASEDSISELGLPYTKIRDAIRIEVTSTKEAADLIRRYPDLFCNFEIANGKMDDVFLTVTGKNLNEEKEKIK